MRVGRSVSQYCVSNVLLVCVSLLHVHVTCKSVRGELRARKSAPNLVTKNEQGRRGARKSAFYTIFLAPYKSTSLYLYRDVELYAKQERSS